VRKMPRRGLRRLWRRGLQSGRIGNSLKKRTVKPKKIKPQNIEYRIMNVEGRNSIDFIT